MNLEGVELSERKKLTSHFVILITGDTGSGKSYAISNMSKEDKARTVVFNFDEKSISEDDSEFLKIYSGFKVQDFELVSTIEAEILKAVSSDKVDRIIIDTFTSMTKLINRWASFNFRGYDVWGNYNNSITQIIHTLKSGTLTYGKFGYVMGHYPPKEGNDIKRYLTTKGREHTNIIEEQFNTVVESFIADGAVFYRADVWDTSDTTKTKLKEGNFKFKRESLTDLEDLFNRVKKIEDNELVKA